MRKINLFRAKCTKYFSVVNPSRESTMSSLLCPFNGKGIPVATGRVKRLQSTRLSHLSLKFLNICDVDERWKRNRWLLNPVLINLDFQYNAWRTSVINEKSADCVGVFEVDEADGRAVPTVCLFKHYIYTIYYNNNYKLANSYSKKTHSNGVVDYYNNR